MFFLLFFAASTCTPLPHIYNENTCFTSRNWLEKRVSVFVCFCTDTFFCAVQVFESVDRHQHLESHLMFLPSNTLQWLNDTYIQECVGFMASSRFKEVSHLDALVQKIYAGLEMQSESTRLQTGISMSTWLLWFYAISRRWWTSETGSPPPRCPAGNCVTCKRSALVRAENSNAQVSAEERVTGLSHLKTRCPFWRPRLMKSLPFPCSPRSWK